MPFNHESFVTNYVRSLFRDGMTPFRYRRGVQSLLGISTGMEERIQLSRNLVSLHSMVPSAFPNRHPLDTDISGEIDVNKPEKEGQASEKQVVNVALPTPQGTTSGPVRRDSAFESKNTDHQRVESVPPIMFPPSVGSLGTALPVSEESPIRIPVSSIRKSDVVQDRSEDLSPLPPDHDQNSLNPGRSVRQDQDASKMIGTTAPAPKILTFKVDQPKQGLDMNEDVGGSDQTISALNRNYSKGRKESKNFNTFQGRIFQSPAEDLHFTNPVETPLMEQNAIDNAASYSGAPLSRKSHGWVQSGITPLSRETTERLDHLQQVVQTLTRKKMSNPESSVTQKASENIQPSPLPPAQQVVIVNQSSNQGRIPSAFWERSHMHRIHLRCLR